jgi:hypothetical protein
MKGVWLALFVLAFSLAGYAQKEIRVEEARDNVGDTVKICTRIFDTKFDENSKGSPTYLYTSSHNPNATLSFIVWGEKRKYFDYKPEKDLREREVCVTGKIELLKDKLIIVIDRQSQVDIK